MSFAILKVAVLSVFMFGSNCCALKVCGRESKYLLKIIVAKLKIRRAEGSKCIK
jgi:hypothetical protein